MRLGPTPLRKSTSDRGVFAALADGKIETGL